MDNVLNSFIQFIKDINSWKKLLMVLILMSFGLFSYYVYVKIDQRLMQNKMNPYEYFAKQDVRDINSIRNLLDVSRSELKCDVVTVFLYQPKNHYFFRQLIAMTPRDKYNDYEKSEAHISLYNLHRLITDLNDTGIGTITPSSGHHDSKLLIAQRLNVSYVLPIHINGIDIGQIAFSFKNKPDKIDIHSMRSVVERVLLKIF